MIPETTYIAKARQLSAEDNFELFSFVGLIDSKMSVPQLSGLIQRMEDAKAKLEVREGCSDES